MEPVSSGIFFATEKETFFYGGDPTNGFDIVKKYDYGGVFGTGTQIPNTSHVAWQSPRGTILGMPDGQCKNIQEENVAPDFSTNGASLYREQDGKKQFLVSLNNATTSKMAAKSFIDSEIIRRQS
jgi:hypothetical protein